MLSVSDIFPSENRKLVEVHWREREKGRREKGEKEGRTKGRWKGEGRGERGRGERKEEGGRKGGGKDSQSPFSCWNGVGTGGH